MTPLDDWPRVKLLLEQALERTGAAREAYLTEACGTDASLRARIDSYLALQDAAQPFLETPAAVLLDESRGQDLCGRVVGPYRLESRIGAGGMGEVYLAQDTSELGRAVALKIRCREKVNYDIII